LRSRRVAAAALALLVSGAAALATGCGGSDGPGSSSTSSSGTPLLDSGAPDVDLTPRLQPERCVGAPLQAKQVPEEATSGAPPPAFGGPVILGTYDIDRLEAYNAFDAGAGDVEQAQSGVTGRFASAVLTLTNDTMILVESYGASAGSLGPPAIHGYAYYPLKDTLFAAQVCPAAVATKPIPYSAVGDSISLFLDDTHRMVLRRRAQ
jgi:hypothetical protein